MNNQRFALAAVMFSGLGLLATGCILGDDPNKNSQLFGGLGGSTGGGGGATGSAGSTGNGMGPIVGTAIATFETGIEGFMIDDYHDTAQTNLNDMTHPASPPPTLTFDNAVGNPSPGSLAVMAPYSGANQYVDIQHTFGTNNLQDWTHKTLHVRIRVTSGTFKGGVQFYVKTGSTYYFAGTYTTLAAGSAWQEFKLNVDAPMMIGPGTGSYDAAHVVSYGMQLNSSGAGAGSTPVTFNIDSFSIDPPLAGGDAGADVTADTAAATDSAAGADTAPSSDAGGN